MINLKRSSKLIVFSISLIAVLYCTAVLTGVFPIIPISASSAQQDTSQEKQLLTWEAIKEFTAGNLSYSEIYDSFYYKEIGSGLYIISFPIEDAPKFFLTASSTSPGAAPMSVMLRCEPADFSLELNAENLGIMLNLSNNDDSYQTINKLFYNEIPIPQNAKTYENIIYLTGKTPDEIMQDYGNLLLNNDWKLIDVLGMKRFYERNINGEELIISVLCMQEGGLQNTDILTVLRFNIESLPAPKNELIQGEQDVQALVEAFGKTLRAVSLSAPQDVTAASIAKNYSDYITPELLQKWQADPQSAPGRLVSSPWPDRIDILRTEMYDTNQYIIHGEIIEVTSTEIAKGGTAAKRPVEITVQQIINRWLITNLTAGAYAQPGPVVYKNTPYGFCFYLPETWQGYTAVQEQWQGAKGGEIIETGPQLLLRHPGWTEKLPRQDIPIMVFTLEQWKALQKGEFFVSAAPIGPGKLGSNSRYVFALPARYNYAFQTGFEEVEEILKSSPLWPSKLSGNTQEEGTGGVF
ncbi:MAG: hypothetical protein ACOWWO_10215 [Peptococcaceae bacterium]